MRQEHKEVNQRARRTDKTTFQAILSVPERRNMKETTRRRRTKPYPKNYEVSLMNPFSPFKYIKHLLERNTQNFILSSVKAKEGENIYQYAKQPFISKDFYHSSTSQW